MNDLIFILLPYLDRSFWVGLDRLVKTRLRYPNSSLGEYQKRSKIDR